MTNENTKLLFFKNMLFGVLISIVATVVVMALFAVILCYVPIDLLYAGTLASVALAVGSFFGGYFFTKIQGKNGMACGALLGAVLFVIVSIISLLADSGSVTLITLIHAAVTTLSGALGGVFGVNSLNKRKY